ncbi:hypothetical protein KL86DES1_21545 [uncultured Desulfovibrio sp.]|uniref:Uncharacterized protein n=1 Tax=uncultured Desulfovibrio sp. TaxID=167968 RepID=A0A212L8M6_9BACT|nr:hypothetical protein KL86DES1_21545 [uncultured Desulfovibrio sp.]VZH34445.1 conserved protein of unknown function [Desulfovibrio sp. 86]
MAATEPTSIPAESIIFLLCAARVRRSERARAHPTRAFSKTLAPAFNRADKLRLRLRGGRLLPHPPEQFQAAAVRRRRSLTDGDSIAREIALKAKKSPADGGVAL